MIHTRKKLVSIFIVIAIILSYTPSVFASSLSNNSTVKVAHITNINATGSNIGTERTNPDCNISQYDISYQLNPSGIEISGQIEGQIFDVAGNIVTTNQNSNVLLFDGEEENANYNLLYLSVERDLPNTTLFFDAFYEHHKEYTNVIKLYLQPKSSSDLIIIEIFIEDNFVSSYLNNHYVPYDAAKANELQLWFVNLYEPIIDYEKAPGNGEASTYANTTTSTLNLSKTYSHMGATININFKVCLYYTLSDLTSNGIGKSCCYFNVIKSDITSDVSAYNSSTQNYIQLEDINIVYSTMPGVVLISQEAVHTNVLKLNGSIAADLSVSFSVGKGPLSISGTLSVDQWAGTMTDSNLVPLYNGNGSYVRTTECGTLPDNYCLRANGSVYGFDINYQDETGTLRSGTVKVKFDYKVINSWDYTDNIVASTTKNLTLIVK